MKSEMKRKYLETLKDIESWATVSEWAKKVAELNPDILVKADREAQSHKRKTTGLREIAARISSIIASGGYEGLILVDESQSPRRVKFLSFNSQKSKEMLAKEDMEEIDRDERIQSDYEKLGKYPQYRIYELKEIARALKEVTGLSFHLDHARAIKNRTHPGKHGPDNAQILLQVHNAGKNNSNWKRFSLSDQLKYIQAVIELQELVNKKSRKKMDHKFLKSVLARLKAVY